MEVARTYTSRRRAILIALVELLKQIDGKNGFNSNLYRNVYPRLKFWDEIEDFPSVHVSTSTETRQYQAGGFKDRFLNVIIRVYVTEGDEDAGTELDKVLEDIEGLLEANARMPYIDNKGCKQHTHQMSIMSIDTDEGILEPIGVAEILIQIQY